jgi:hypothetical protein
MSLSGLRTWRPTCRQGLRSDQTRCRGSRPELRIDCRSSQRAHLRCDCRSGLPRAGVFFKISPPKSSLSSNAVTLHWPRAGCEDSIVRWFSATKSRTMQPLVRSLSNGMADPLRSNEPRAGRMQQSVRACNVARGVGPRPWWGDPNSVRRARAGSAHRVVRTRQVCV